MTPLTDNARWDAIQRRDRTADGAFLFAVKTTGVYCRPTCCGRPLRRNVAFYETAQAARAAGYRPCKRCRPDEPRETLRFAAGPCDLGRVLVCVSDAGVRAILLGDDDAALRRDLEGRFPEARLREDSPGLRQVLAEVVALAADPAQTFDQPLDLTGGDFALAVAEALRAIPAGRTVSYAELARAIGRPRAVRAVARACAANPLAIAVPCHRVIRSDAILAGYRWGAERKRALLAREAAA